MCYQVDLIRPEPCAFFGLQLSPGAASALEDTLGLTLATDGLAIERDAVTVIRLGPSEWLLSTALANEADQRAALDAIARHHHALVTLMTDAFASFEVRGPEAMPVLSQAIAIDLRPDRFPAGAATRCGFAKTSAVLHCRQPTTHYRLLVDVAYEAYADRWLRAAAGEPIDI